MGMHTCDLPCEKRLVERLESMRADWLRCGPEWALALARARSFDSLEEYSIDFSTFRPTGHYDYCNQALYSCDAFYRENPLPVTLTIRVPRAPDAARAPEYYEGDGRGLDPDALLAAFCAFARWVSETSARISYPVCSDGGEASDANA